MGLVWRQDSRSRTPGQGPEPVCVYRRGYPAAAKAGASVTHVDASKGMVAWAKENAQSSGLADAPIRWIVDDCVKFVEREIRRGNRYDAVIMDLPPMGGTKRGNRGR